MIATVRPETMLGDMAVAVNPADERYSHLIGQHAILPIVGRRLPIIADSYVKPEFGTGAFKITPAHDSNDFEIGRAHGLDEISVIGEDGRMTAEAGEPFAGMTVMSAATRSSRNCDPRASLSASRSYVHDVPHSHRSGERIEPLISLQWFMRMDELVGPAAEAVASGRVRIVPESRHGATCIGWRASDPGASRASCGGAIACPSGIAARETYVGLEPPEGAGWEQDPDVLDMWFSSALWPFATLGWPEDTPQLRAFYPTDVLLTARDIIFLWVARMVMMGLEFTGEIPFHDVYIHPVIQSPDGRRMSKSLGTGIDPLDLVDGVTVLTPCASDCSP